MLHRLINPELTRKFVYVVAGITGYMNQDERSIIDMLARLRAEARITEFNWNLYGYSKQTTSEYFEDCLQRDEADVLIVPQNNHTLRDPTDEEEWMEISESKRAVEEVFPHNPSNAMIKDNHDSTWYLHPDELKRGHWIKEVPRFFQIWSEKGDIFRGLVLKNLTLYKYGDWWFDGASCKYYRTSTNFKRGGGARSLQVYVKLDQPHSDAEYIPVIASAKTIWPYSVNLIHPDDPRR